MAAGKQGSTQKRPVKTILIFVLGFITSRIFTKAKGKKNIGGEILAALVLIVILCISSIKEKITTVFNNISNGGRAVEKIEKSVIAFRSFDEAVAYRNNRFSEDERFRLNNLFKKNGTSGDPYFDAAQSYIISQSTGSSMPTKNTSIQTGAQVLSSSPIRTVSTNFLATQNYTWLTSKVPIPQYILDKATQYRSNFLTEHAKSASNLTFVFYYNNDGDACLQATVTPKAGYTWEKGTWICQWWSGGGGEIGEGNIKYKQTKKNLDDAEIRIEERRKDSTFAEIEKIVFQIATEYDYDYMGAYGKSVKYRSSTVKKAYCDGYTDVVVKAFQGHQLVDHVEKYTGGDHAWNVIVLKDGRKIYTDATWYDGNSIDDEGYVIHIPRRNPVDLTFDLAEFNSLGGAIDKITGKPIKVHFDYTQVRRVL